MSSPTTPPGDERPRPEAGSVHPDSHESHASGAPGAPTSAEDHSAGRSTARPGQAGPPASPYGPAYGPQYGPPTPAYAAAPAATQPGGFKRGFGMGMGLGLGFLITAVAISLIGGIFAVMSLGTLMQAAPSGASASTRTIWGPAGGSGTLRAIDVSGAIMTSPDEGALFSTGAYGYEIADILDGLEADDADGVVMLVNTPGGSITGSKAIADAIERYQDRTGKPLLVHVEGMSASGGVYSTAPADAIYADHGSLIGSVGVIFGPFQRFRDVVAISGSLLSSGVSTTGGITEEYITRGTGKDFGNPFRDMTDGERQMLENIIQPEYERFVEQVSSNRGIPEAQLVDEIGAGIFEPERAQELGFVDGVMGRTEFFRHAAEEAGLDPDDTRVVAPAEPSPLEALLGAERSWGVAPALVPAEGVSVELNRGICDGLHPLVYAGDLKTVCG